MSSTSVLVRVDLPEVSVPDVDIGGVRSLAGVLEGAAEWLAASAWRLGAASAAMSERLGWCGPASTAFLGSCGEQRAWYVNACTAMTAAASTCRRYADTVDAETVDVRRQLQRRHQLESELSQLRAHVARLDEERAAASTSGAAAVQLFTSMGSTSPEAARLQEWADRLAGDARALKSAIDRVRSAIHRADTVAADELDRVAAMTLAARAARQRESLRQAADRALHREDSGAGSRIHGFVDGVGDGMGGAVSAVAGLIGLEGDIGAHWTSLRLGLGEGLTHPVDLGKALIDWDDISHSNWGHWAGTAGPTALASFFTGGGAAAAKAADVLELIRSADGAGEIARLAAAERAAIAQVALGRTQLSDVVLGRGGLLRHEESGGHTLRKHVGLTLEQLSRRLDREWWTHTASTFPDINAAEVAVGHVLDAQSATIVQWMYREYGDPARLSLELDLGREVGLSMKTKNLKSVSAIKLVLVRDSSALGFHIDTAYPIR